MQLTEHTPTGVDKVKRYGWIVQDEPGEYRLLHKDALQIHPAYQRDLLQEKVKEITAAWSWIALAALVVGERGGEFWVIDGQHRAAAAKRRSDVTHLPCMVFRTKDVQQEARGFLTIQTGRKPVTAIAKQKAMVTAGDQVAIYVQQQIDALGLQVNGSTNKVGQIKCIAWCNKRAGEDKEAFSLVLSVGAELSLKDQIPVHERLLEGLWVLHARVHAGGGIDDNRLAKRLREKGASALLAAANRASAYYAQGGGRIWAEGMLTEINKGLRSKFTMDGNELAAD